MIACFPSKVSKVPTLEKSERFQQRNPNEPSQPHKRCCRENPEEGCPPDDAQTEDSFSEYAKEKKPDKPKNKEQDTCKELFSVLLLAKPSKLQEDFLIDTTCFGMLI